MDAEYKTLRELDVKPGDVVESMFGHKATVSNVDKHSAIDTDGDCWSLDCIQWCIVSRAPRNDSPKLWRDMTPEEKGALLLAEHEGKVIEVLSYNFAEWLEKVHTFWKEDVTYRIRPEPKRETVALCWRHDVGGVKNRIGTIDLNGDVPDFSTIKPEGQTK